MTAESLHSTHRARTAVDPCRYLRGLIAGAVQGVSKEQLLSSRYAPVAGYWTEKPLCPETDAIAAGSFKHEEPPGIRGSGCGILEFADRLYALSDEIRDNTL